MILGQMIKGKSGMQKLRGMVLVWLASLFWASAAVAQAANDVVWVQIEAHPNLATAQARAAIYAAELEDVNGFSLGSGWYGIALGPYRRADADQVLRVYRAERVIPSDSYIAFSASFGQQYFPPGVDLLSQGVIATTPDAGLATPTVEAAPTPQASDETPAEARRSERLLNRAEREELQVALKWAGFYASAIDGAFGRGTRASMASWQEANGFEATGVLTTLQRAALLQQYNAVLDGMDLTLINDLQAGIEIQIPQGVVEFDGYEYPFAKYAPKTELGARVLLISQEGNQDTLFGLYDILQTLEIVPLDGPRQRNRTSFRLVGENDRIVSHTEAQLLNGQIKGFTLVWPAGDEARRQRVLQEMQASFQILDGALDPSETGTPEQAIDLVAGLQIRQPRLSRSGFFVNTDGDAITTLEAVQNCERVTLDETIEAEVAAADDKLGIVVLKPKTDIVPRGVANFAQSQPRLQAEAAVSGFSYEGLLGAPTLTFGRISELRGLRGERELTRLELETLGGDAGGPVFGPAGNVVGMLLPRPGSGRQLPAEVNFAANSDSLRALLDSTGVRSTLSASQAPMAPEDITSLAQEMTVLVSCWE